MLKVYNQCCGNCLLSPKRIVSPQRAKDIIEECKQTQTHFICHKASMRDEQVLCNKFYHQFGQFSQMVRISERLKMVQFVEQTDNTVLTPYNKQ
jgi:hypothetical protein